MGRTKFAVLMVTAACLSAASTASAATLTVDDDHAQCPAAGYVSVQAAVDAAVTGDTVAICPGVYTEGNGATGSNALTIAFKDISIRGAGADLVVIQPKRTTATGGQIAETTSNLRNGVGDIISVSGSKAAPTTVNISGVTVDGNGVYVEAGVVYRDAQGTLNRDRVTDIVTSEGNAAETTPGGYRYAFPGIGIAQVTCGPQGNNLTPACPTNAATLPARPLTISQTRVARYNTVGILIDSALTDFTPATPNTLTQATGVSNAATLTGDVVVGRTQCTAFNTPTPPPYILGGGGATPALNLPGNCSTVGLTTTGSTFGQDGVRVTAGSTATISDSTITANLVHGTGAPAYGSATNNANLTFGSGLRLVGAGASTITSTNLTDNAYGALNTQLNGTAANTATPLSAENNFWGLRTNATSNVGPVIAPISNPPYQENPVNGVGVADATCVTSAAGVVQNSTAVDFCPFRNGNQADPNGGEYPVAYAPLPVSDSGPSVTINTPAPANVNRGDMVTVSANASDDFSIAKISFYDGTDLIGTAVPPANSVTFTIPANAPCASRTLTAVAEDSTGQTASSTTTITVVGPNSCQPIITPPPPPPPPTPVAPTIALINPPATVPEAGATLSAVPTVDSTRTVTKVEFFLGNRALCTDTTAPYQCDLLPQGGDVGDQSIRAVVTDSGAQTATATAPTTVGKFTPSALTISVKGKTFGKPGHKKLFRRLSGFVQFADRANGNLACATGTVTLTIEKNGISLFPLTQVPLAPDCSYALKLKVPKTKKNNFNVTASFSGNAILSIISNNRRFK